MKTSSPSNDLFPERLRAARLRRSISQVELSEMASLPQSTVSLFESGGRKPSFENLRRLADALMVSVDYLLGRVDDFEGTAGTATALYRGFERLDDQGKKVVQDMIDALAKKAAAKGKRE